MYLPWIPGVTVRSLRNFCFGVSYFTDGAFGNSQTRLVNTRRLVFTDVHKLIFKHSVKICLKQPFLIYWYVGQMLQNSEL